MEAGLYYLKNKSKTVRPNMNKMSINIIGAAQSLGVNCDGVQYGPDFIRKYDLVDRLSGDNIVVTDSGNVTNNQNIECCLDSRSHRVSQILDFNERLSSKVVSVLSDNQMPLVLGGDHSLSIGSVGGASEVFGVDNLCLIWIDAHTDINTPETSPTGNIHGMTIASLLGLGDNRDRSNLFGGTAKLKPENIIYVATREIDKGEAKIIEELGISVIWMKDIVRYGHETMEERLRELLNNLATSNIYVSIDIDVMDPNLAPGTGVAVPDGIDTRILYKFLEIIAETGKVRGAELVEVNPMIDNPDNRTSILAVDIIDYFVKCIRAHA